MTQFKEIVLISVVILGSLFFSDSLKAQLLPEIIEFDGDRLTYFSDAEHNRIPDFSHAGYMGGGVPLPNVPVMVTISPVGGDNSAHIQQAIDTVSKLPMDGNGLRGAVLLKPGNYFISNNLTIDKSGVVLSGSGNGTDPSTDTIIKVSQAVKGTVLQIGNEDVNWYRGQPGTVTEMDFEFLPVGSRSFNVQNPEFFEPGDDIIIRHYSTDKWLQSINYGETKGAAPWEPGYIDLYYYRTISGIRDSTISIDAPIYDHFDASLSSPIVYKPIRENLVQKSGVENFRIQILTAGPTAENHADNAIIFRGVENGWADQVSVAHFKVIGIGTHTSRNITISNSRAVEPHSQLTGTRRYNFNTDLFSNNILFTNVIASGGRRDFMSNGTSVASGIVFHDSRSISAEGASEGHQKWSQALLYDSIIFETPVHYNVLSLYNRGDFGSSHGWGAVHSVAWNVDAGDNYIFIQKPPRAQNYAIGNRGKVSGEGLFAQSPGYIEGTGTQPFPSSLYEAQLAERLNYGLPPDVPVQVDVIDADPNTLVVRWQHFSTTDSQVIIERSSNEGETFTEVARMGSGEQEFVDENIGEELYYYRLRAKNKNGFSAYTYPESGFPKFTNEVLSGVHLISPSDGKGVKVEGEYDEFIEFSWETVKTGLDVWYSLSLFDDTNTMGDPVAVFDPIFSNSLRLSYSFVDSLLKAEGLQSGDLFYGSWSVTTKTSTFQQRSVESYAITLEKGSLTNSNIEGGGKVYLDQNFPNPFNPVTTIRYHLSVRGNVKLEVYNMAGIRIAELDKGVRSIGSHEVHFSAKNLASGIYFYRLNLDGHIETRKMLVIK